MRSTTASSATLPPVDPEQPQPQMTCREIQTLRDANDSLQACVDNLQQVLKEKALETVRMEQQYLEDIKERDRQVDSLHRQLQERMRLTSSTASREEAYNSRTSAFLKERELLMRKVQQLEEQLQKCQFSGSLGSAFVQLK
ncbi:hypothetical protein Tcan_18085 [Toxocara canis]|uniref:Uncharacterized protein n=1 Tax=Toxocara canis TaxID=6265 RepID=A0A0B2UYF4_TOXCA|nr:hypothetical protein Tcan_18085 [Toxocara canis]